MKTKYIKIMIMGGVVCLSLASCASDYMDVSSTENVDESSIFATTEGEMMAINGIHSRPSKEVQTPDYQ